MHRPPPRTFNIRIALCHCWLAQQCPSLRPTFTALTLTACLTILSLHLQTTSSCADSPTRPNILAILADDQGWGDLSINGNTNLATPKIDSLARDGATFDRFFVCPVCSPTRAEFLTGRYHPHGGVSDVSTGGERLDLDERTIAQTFRAAGYATGCFGKWHNGSQYPYHPNARGFAEYYGFCSGHWGQYFDWELQHNGQPLRSRGYITDDLTDHAMRFIEENQRQPFFCYVPYNTPHSPMQVPDRFYQKFASAELPLRYQGPEKEDLAHTRAALAMCENIDWNVGRLLTKLDQLRLADRTIVLYFSDNGPNGWRYNGGMRGRKGSTDEGGVRVPFMIRWPGHIPPGTRIPQIAAAIDLLPTLADLAAVPVLSQKPLDGKSLKPLLTGSAHDWPDRMIFSHWAGRVSVRTQQYRLDDRGRLYDIVADPGQKHDVTQQNPDVAQRLSKAVHDWRRDVLSELKPDTRPFTVGYRQMPATYLPARDGRPHGGIRRSAGAPNCSYFTHWTSTEDWISWDIQLATPGRYEAAVYYTCPKEDIGSTVELSFGNASARTKIGEPHDPPLLGAAQDRAARQESYVKDFRPLKLGEMQLQSGRGLLTLRAVSIPGRQVMDVRQVRLTLLDNK